MTQEALKLALEALTYIYTETTADEDELIDQAITAIKEALAQPEPVIDKSAAIRIATALGWSPQRTWVGLNTDEMKEIADRYHLKPPNVPVAFRTIEVKLKQKNGYAEEKNNA